MYITSIPTSKDEATLPGDDLLEALSSDLYIPMLLNGEGSPVDESPNDILQDAMREQAIQRFEDVEYDSPFYQDDFSSNFTDGSEEVIIKDVKLEPRSPEFIACKLPPSPSPSQSESSSGSEYQSEILRTNHKNNKFAIETPPISPPQNDSPPTSPVPAQNNPPVLQKVKLLPLNSVNLKDGHAQKFLFSNNNPAKRICIQSKVEKPTSKDSTRKTIILSPEDFAALTQKVKQNSNNPPLKVQNLPINKSVKIQNDLNSLSVQPNAIATKNNQVKIINANPAIQIHSKTPAVSMINPSVTKSDSKSLPTIIVKNEHKISPSSIVIKNDVPVIPPILVKKETSNLMPIVIKNEFPEFIDYHDQDRQDSEIKALKRQQRMIKNRESACLSRKKKKEYVTSLENEITELKEQNRQLTVENTELKKRLSHLEGSSIKKFGNQSYGVNKKNTAVFCAFIFMVSLNIGSLGSMLKQTPLTDDSNSVSFAAISSSRHSGRTLLWSNADEEDNTNYKENSNNTMPMCSRFINQTESRRIYLELSHLTTTKPGKRNESKSSQSPVEGELYDNYFIKNDISNNMVRNENTKPRSRRVKPLQKKHNRINHVPSTSGLNAVQVFSPISEEYAKLSDILGKRDDTLYVVYFTEKDLLLPASRTNNTIRPRMSLVIPAVPVDGQTPQYHVTMMQIDCEVVNTQLLHLKESLIPKHLRKPHQFEDSQPKSNNIDVSENVSNNTKKYKPYFLKSSLAASMNDNSVAKKEFKNNFKVGNFKYDLYPKNERKSEQKEFANQTEESKKNYPQERKFFSKKSRRDILQ